LIISGLNKLRSSEGIDLAKIDNKTIFGGKKNFIRRCKGLITNAEWKALRIMPIYSIGQANTKGNRRLVHRWKEMADSVAVNWVGLYEEFKSRHLGWRSPPCSSRSSEYGAYGKRLLVHQKGVSV
jgi:hypothetical protein